jgi:hypothetical protein
LSSGLSRDGEGWMANRVRLFVTAAPDLEPEIDEIREPVRL